MQFVEQNVRIFVPGQENLYRRLSVRECARIQTFPDSFIFYYKNISAVYKMMGNAVPVRMANILAKKILEDLSELKTIQKQQVKRWEFVLNMIENAEVEVA